MGSLIIGLLLSGTGLAHAELETVPYVDVEKYLGTWYQIARNPLFFENGCVCSRQVLSSRDDGLVGVYNTCNREKIDGPLLEISGTATNDDPTSNARFTVDFGLPNKGAYWIIAIEKDYQYAVVSDPSKKSLYILSKTPELPEAQFTEAVYKASTQVDTSKLERTTQLNCTYPPSAP